MSRSTSKAMRASLEDLPGIILSMVSAATVAHGAMLLRNQSPFLMFAMGAGVAAATFVLDKRLIDRLNTVRPQQNILMVLLCWLPLFTVATCFAAVTAFSAIAPSLGAAETEHARREHWASETGKVSAYISALQTAVQNQANAVAAEIDVEQRTIADARLQKLPVSLDHLRELRRKATAVNALRARAATVSVPPAEPPDDHSQALTVLNTSFQALRALDADARSLIERLPNPPAYGLLAKPSTDLQSILVRETSAKSAPAVLAWSTAGLIEILPLVALLRGGRKIPLAVRLLEMRRRLTDVRDVLCGRVPLVSVPIVVEPFQVRGIVRARLLPTSTARDCMPRLQEAIAEVPAGTSGTPVILRLATADGVDVVEDEPLLRQLDGGPLTVHVGIER